MTLNEHRSAHDLEHEETTQSKHAVLLWYPHCLRGNKHVSDFFFRNDFRQLLFDTRALVYNDRSIDSINMHSTASTFDFQSTTLTPESNCIYTKTANQEMDDVGISTAISNKGNKHHGGTI